MDDASYVCRTPGSGCHPAGRQSAAGCHYRTNAKIVTHAWYVTFQMAEVAVPKDLFREILRLIAELRAPPAPA